jgi:hypothetical protein
MNAVSSRMIDALYLSRNKPDLRRRKDYRPHHYFEETARQPVIIDLEINCFVQRYD